MSAPASITLSEWETVSPKDSPLLVDRFIEGVPGARNTAELLEKGKLLRVTELRHGLEVTTFSHVGRVTIGDLSVTILPKIKGTPLVTLVRYAYGFRRLKLQCESSLLVGEHGFEDLLISQLNAEVQELISRGLLRKYVACNERLSSPRGRIDLTRLALDGGTATASLPCRHYPRIEDTLLNRVLVAGLRLAASMAGGVELRRESRRLVTLLDEQVSPIRLDRHLLELADRQMNRLTTAYAPAMSIIRLLVESKGVVLEGESEAFTLPGFLFDMNAFFQALLSRFLKENLSDCSVLDEYGLKGMMRYLPKFNPMQRNSPTPRPDYVVVRGKRVASILDAKYRDLWEEPLPREMLYQLVVYAVSDPTLRRSSILYPTMDGSASEARIQVSDPIRSDLLGQVCLRPVDLRFISEIIGNDTAQGRREREAYAQKLAFGDRD